MTVLSTFHNVEACSNRNQLLSHPTPKLKFEAKVSSQTPEKHPNSTRRQHKKASSALEF
jgi:hypothetical protein